MPPLTIRDEQTGRSWRIWPDPQPIPSGEVREARRYIFELRGEHNGSGADLLIDDVRLEALRTDEPMTSRWRWSPGFHAGTVEAQLLIPGTGPRRFEVDTDPDLRKLTRDEFDTMVREILEDTFALFALSGFRRSVARGIGNRPPAVARLEFLRSRVEEIEAVSRAVARQPRRMLTAEEELVPYHRAVRTTGTEILRSFRSGRVLADDSGSSRLPTALKGFLPEKIRLRQRRNSLDIAEHRQMAACLRAWQSWLTSAAEILERSTGPDSGDHNGVWPSRCRRLARRIGQLRQLPVFAEAGDARPVLTLSSVFRNDPNYRRFYQLWRDMNLGISGVFGGFLGMPLARTYDLYELWCFLRLLRAVSERYGYENFDAGELFISEPNGTVTVSAGAVEIAMGPDWRICFQKQYREFWREPDRQGSFSREMRPDVTLGMPSEGASRHLIVLDAKYRIDQGLNDALNSIHTYRDALVRKADTGSVEGIVTAAYLMTPHLPGPDAGAGYRETAMPGRLFHPEYRKRFRFGAVIMRPGMTVDDVGQVLETIVADATG